MTAGRFFEKHTARFWLAGMVFKPVIHSQTVHTLAASE